MNFNNSCVSASKILQKEHHKRGVKEPWYLSSDVLADHAYRMRNVASIKGGIFDKAVKVTIKG